jgi:hypothetical protein
LITLRQKIFTFDVHGNASGGGPEKKDGNFDRSSKVRYKESFPASFGVLK